MNKKLYFGHFPSKKLGQHFLIDQSVINKIINVINPKNIELLIEIGPGLGSLTRSMLLLIDDLYVIEIDKQLVNKLKNFTNSYKLIIFCQDVLSFDFFSFLNIKKNVRVFGNLPYNISTAVLLHLIKYVSVFYDMNFMLQKEVADRILAQPDSKNYGRLSIIIQYFFDVKFLFEVSSKSFFPEPKVTSVFLKFKPYITYQYTLRDVSYLSLITKLAFGQRRKMIKNSLSNLFNEHNLIKLGISPLLRAENLSIIEYCCLANYLYDCQLKK
ncbi:MAG: 16S rRNA (adenine(1518)-N(6)/adenine(1519)-N(6))-dimethyltransferase RsmA [Buchnera aphidicola (Eriosoma harunire)]